MSTLAPSFLLACIILAGNEDNHKMLDGLEIRQGQRLWSKLPFKIPIDILLMPLALRPGVWMVFWTLIMFFDNIVDQICPSGLQLGGANTKVTFLDLHL